MPTYVITTSPRLSSLPNYFWSLAEALHRLGNEVIVITDKNKPHLLPPNKTGMSCYSWPSRRPTTFKDFLFFLRLCRQHKPDCVIGNFGAQNIVLMAGMLLGIKYRVAFWHTVFEPLHVDNNKSTLKLNFLLKRKKWLLKLFATHIFTNSDSNKEELVKYFGLDPVRIHKFYPLIPDPVVNGQVVANRDYVISFVARLDKSKRQYILLQALPELRRRIPGLKVYIVGTGTEAIYLKALADTLNIADMVTFTGDVPLAEVYRILTLSKVHISASVQEGYGLVNVEALAVGTPIIAPPVGGLKEIVMDGYNGLHYDPLNQQELIENIISIVDGDWNTWSLNARHAFLERFCTVNIGRQVDEYERLFGRRSSF